MVIEISNSLKREIGQHFVFGFHGFDVGPDVLSLIQEYYVGAIIIMKRNVQDAKQLRSLIAKLQLAAREAGHVTPLLIGIDQENGLVSAFSKDAPLGGTQFPGAMALAAADDYTLVEKVYSSSAREMHLCGINWDYAPVCDINTEPKNPVIGVRSFGDDAVQVSQLVEAAAKGLAAQGVAPSPKHFPGHGDTHIDSHLGLPRIMKTMEELRSTELVPFINLINSGGVATIMTGHMALPLVTGDDKPCSLSRVITTDLLRQELKYDGVIVTDCLEMEAVVLTYGSERGAVEALGAGGDIAMLCHRIDRQLGAINAVYGAFSSGELLMEDLKSSGERVRKLKEKFVGSWDEVVIPDLAIEAYEELRRVNKVVAQEAYSRSIVVLNDENHILPISKDGSAPIVLFTPMIQSLNMAVDDSESFARMADGGLKNTAGPSFLRLVDAVSKAFPKASVQHVVYGPNENLLPQDFPNAATVIFATRQAEQSLWQLEYLRNLIQSLYLKESKIIILATLTPYEVLSSVAGPGAVYMCTFEHTAEAFRAAVSVISGESLPRGILPVKNGF